MRHESKTFFIPLNKYLPTIENGSKLLSDEPWRVVMITTKKSTKIEISASLIPTCLQVGVALGVDSISLQRWAESIDLDTLETERIDYTWVVELIDVIRKQSGRSDIAFLLGEAFGFHFSPVVSTYLSSLDTLRTLLIDLDLVKDYFSRQFDVQVVELPDVVKVSMQMQQAETLYLAADPAAVLAVAGIMMFCRKQLSLLLARETVIEAFHFRHARPDNIGDYERYLNAPLCFDSDYDGFVLPVSLLDQPLRGALPLLNIKARQRMQKAASPLYAPQSLAEKILDAFATHHRLLSLPLVATAEYFNVSERTLQRKLRSESLTFFELQEDAKKVIAAALLKEGLSAETVADRLGFSDRRSFCRAFKRWYDETPSAYRVRELG